MRKIFWRFYCMVALCFLASSLVVGAIYKHILQQNSQYYLADMFRTTLYLIEDELIDVPQDQWPRAIKQIRDKISMHIDVNNLEVYPLTKDQKTLLGQGEIVMLEEQGLFLQRIPGSRYMVILGPIDYLNSVYSLEWVDYLMLFALCLSLALPAFLWLRPLWRQLQELSFTAQVLGTGDFSARVNLPASSPLNTLATTFNRMAQNIQQLVDDRKLMIDAISHDLRTPMARLRYRIEALRMTLSNEEAKVMSESMAKDVDQLGEMTDELLLFSHLDRPILAMQKEKVVLVGWVKNVLEDFHWREQMPILHHQIEDGGLTLEIDPYYLRRAMTNLLMNARRYCKETIQIVIENTQEMLAIHIDDDGPGIPESERANVLKPFVRLDQARSANTGGYGMGLAIVQKILSFHEGEVRVSQSPLGGARVTLCWPVIPG